MRLDIIDIIDIVVVLQAEEEFKVQGQARAVLKTTVATELWHTDTRILSLVVYFDKSDSISVDAGGYSNCVSGG